MNLYDISSDILDNKMMVNGLNSGMSEEFMEYVEEKIYSFSGLDSMEEVYPAVFKMIEL